MTVPRRIPELEPEREVDLARWGKAVVRLWWLPLAGLVAGAVIGFAFSLRGGDTYQATALISLGQTLSPGGSVIPSFQTNPRAVSDIVSSAAVRAQAADAAGISPESLEGRITVAQLGTVTGAGASRATPIISLSVEGTHPVQIEAAANALANQVVQKTTAPYVSLKIRTYTRTLANVDRQLSTLTSRLGAITRALKASGRLDPFRQLVVVSQADNAEARQGNLITQQEVLQNQLAFAKEVESAKVITPARAEKAGAHSHRSSLLIGALVGLILGAIAAIVADARGSRGGPALAAR